MQRARKILTAAILLALVPIARAADDGKSLRILPKPDKPRFEVKERDWPKSVGDASICLWKHDKTAAVSITIDDNQAPDHSWWLEISKKYDFRPTWFVISRRVDGKGFGGSWADFIKLKDAGHDIQSHTVDHFSKSYTDILPVEENYAKAIKDIEAGVPGIKVQTLAYPGGVPAGTNKPEIAARYYIASRGTAGHFNQANFIDYNNTNSISGTPSLDVAHKWAGFPNVVTLNPNQKKIYRAWVSIHYHGAKEDTRKSVIELLEFIKKHPDGFWNAPFTEVAKYGQERDTATLNAKANGNEIELTLSDKMDDTLFDFPLTLKVRINNDWKQITAKQGDKEIPVTLIQHQNNNYALVEATPDRGPVTLKQTPAKQSP